MRAVMQERYGAPDEVLETRDVPLPTPGPDEVLINVRAAGVGIGDWLVANGLPYIARPQYGLRRPKTSVVGFELAGSVEAVGEKVTALKPGDEVFGQVDGALAEYVSAPNDSVTRKPDNISFEEAAAVPVSAFAALQALRDKGGISAEQKVLIVGASGGVGCYAVQMAKAFGAKVTGVCGTDNVDLVRSLGADRVIDYKKQHFTEDGERYDLVLEMAGNNRIRDLRSALTNKGTLVIVGGSGGRWFMGFGRTLRAVLMSPFVSQRLQMLISNPNAEDLATIREMISSGRLTPVVGRAFPLDEVKDAYAHVGGRHTSGRTVVSMAE